MKRLSYTTANAVIHAPHTYILKLADAPRFTTRYFEEGKKAHRLVQDVVSGVLTMAELDHLPEFEVVENGEFDSKCHLTHPLSDKWEIHGYVDLLSHKHKRIGDIKSGGRWSLVKALSHPQFAGYSLMSGYSDFYLINLPRNPAEWTQENVRVSRFEITKDRIEAAKRFFEKAIYTIEHIKEALAEERENKKPGRSPYCYYIDCEFCNA